MSLTEKSYPIFIYLGIFFFIAHILIHGFGIDLSYFGLFLIYVGYFKIELYGWFFTLLWIMITIEIINLGNTFYNRFFKPEKNKKKREKKVQFNE